MPQLKDMRQFRLDATIKLSENIRTLALAEIAVFWIFRTEDAGTFSLPTDFLGPALFCVSALCLDFLQYLYKSTVWHIIILRKEDEFYQNSESIDENKEYEIDGKVNIPTDSLFYLKALSLATSFVWLAISLANRLSFT